MSDKQRERCGVQEVLAGTDNVNANAITAVGCSDWENVTKLVL